MKERLRIVLNAVKRMRYFIIFAILLLSVNAYAWFVYVTRIDSNITAKIRSWNVMFEVHDDDIASEVTFSVGEMYPGMPDFNDYASIVNNGETAGEVFFTIKRVKIFDNVYDDAHYSQGQLIDMLTANYPFVIDISLTNARVEPGHTEYFNIDITWPYESGDDATDTYWGNYAYAYLQNDPTATCISVTAEVRVNQESLESSSETSGESSGE